LRNKATNGKKEEGHTPFFSFPDRWKFNSTAPSCP
jgi:hypothetical protein